MTVIYINTKCIEIFYNTPSNKFTASYYQYSLSLGHLCSAFTLKFPFTLGRDAT
jgi:hypothetical protein